MPLPPPAPMPAPSQPRSSTRSRRWPWIAAGAGLVVALLAGGTAFLVRRDDPDTAARSDLLERVDALLRERDTTEPNDGSGSGDGAR